MLETDTLKLPLYEMDDMANLTDGYNEAMRKIDTAHEKNESRFPISSENIEDGGINTVDIANGAVTENKVATAAITPTKLAEGAVTAQALAEGAVTGQALAEGAVTAQALAEGAVSLQTINQNAIDHIVTQGSNNLISSDAVFDTVNALSQFGTYASQSYTIPSQYGSGLVTVLFSPNNNYMKFYGSMSLLNSIPLVPIPGLSGYNGWDTGIIVPFEVPEARIIWATMVRLIAKRGAGNIENFRPENFAIGTDKHLYMFPFSTNEFTIQSDQIHFVSIIQNSIIGNAEGFTGVIDDGNISTLEELA